MVVAIILSPTCRANSDVIDAVAIQPETKYIGADSMSLLHKIAAVRTFNGTNDRSSRQKPSVVIIKTNETNEYRNLFFWRELMACVSSFIIIYSGQNSSPVYPSRRSLTPEPRRSILPVFGRLDWPLWLSAPLRPQAPS